MSDTVIKVENLSKSYLIRHQSGERYTALRDVLTNGVKSVASSVLRGARVPLGRGLRVGNATPPPATRHSPPTTEEFWALNDVSFEVKQGERVGIIGRNGAGKSTLLKILSRITEPTKGRVHIKGRVASLLEVGTGFHPELTGRENISLNGAILGMSREEIRRKFDEIVAFAEVEKFLDTPVKRYSSGMYVRLAFAVAAHLEPEILVVDEVLAVGDAAFQKKCLGKMEDVANEGRTVLFVSHNMGAVSSLCSRGFLITKGQMQHNGGIDSVIDKYLNGENSTDYSGDLVEHPGRTREFKPLLTSFEMGSNNGTAYYGEPVTLRIGYQFPSKIAVPQFCASFLNERGVVAFTVISDYQPNNIPSSLQGKGWVECSIGYLPLLPGSYTVNLRLWQPGQKLDDIENVARVTVEWTDRQIGQFNWNSSMGIVYVDATWSMVNSESMQCTQDSLPESVLLLATESTGTIDE